MAKDEAKKSPTRPVAEEQDTKEACKISRFFSWLRCPCQCAADKDSRQSKK